MSEKGFIPVLIVILITLAAGAGGYYISNKVKNSQTPVKQEFNTSSNNQSSSSQDQAAQGDSAQTQTFTSTKVDLTHLPLGDNKVSKTAQKGYIYLCRTQTDGGGAFNTGPWINETDKTWDLTKKLTVDGSVSWPNAKLTVSVNGQTRSLVGNGLPSHLTGTYPIGSTDDAYKYDRNPNSIKEQSLSLNLPSSPTVLATPECIGGEVGVMLSGIPIFNGFDAGGRDAAAYEVQDQCSGHPQVSGMYHYHSLSKCLKDETPEGEHSKLIGYAFDGFGIYGVKGENGLEVSTNDLDECHGHTHQISWDGKNVNMYHYHMSYDFPYSVGCFRGKKSVEGPLGGGMQGAQTVPQGGSMGRAPMNGFPPPPPPR